MLSNKFIRFLVVANGILFLMIAIIVLFIVTKEFLGDIFRRRAEPAGVIVGENLEDAKKHNLALQGISYESPKSITNSDNFYVSVNTKTYKEAKRLKATAESAGDFSYYNFSNTFNILFLDKDYKVIQKLLAKKGLITDVRMPFSYSKDDKPDTTIKNIAYKIVFADSNKDGKLDAKDDQDLYISDLSGKDLTQVTEEIEIESYRFQNSRKEIFIEYYERGDDSEYRRKKFLIYDIASKTSRKLESLERALDEIEAQLVN